jgi:hypothetical protein
LKLGGEWAGEADGAQVQDVLHSGSGKQRRSKGERQVTRVCGERAEAAARGKGRTEWSE